MRTELIDEIIAILPQDRTKFVYFKDKYAVDLLRYATRTPRTVAELKRSRLAPLLEKPVVRQALAKIGSGLVTSDALVLAWEAPAFTYLLTLGRWGRNAHARRWYFQTTANDANLVLQLNFSNEHNSAYRSLIGDDADRPFEYLGHPIARWPYRTLAWARIDLSFETGEALVEEVQTDWIRYALSARQWLRSSAKPLDETQKRKLRYIESVALRHEAIWQEAMLSAALWFLHCELGLRKVFYHTKDCGWRLKRIRGSKPPASLYDALPRRFCFRRVRKGPEFLKAKLKRYRAGLEFFEFDFGLTE